MWKKCCPGSQQVNQEVMNKCISECCGAGDVSDPEKTQESLRNCCSQHYKPSEEEEKGSECM